VGQSPLRAHEAAYSGAPVRPQRPDAGSWTVAPLKDHDPVEFGGSQRQEHHGRPVGLDRTSLLC